MKPMITNGGPHPADLWAEITRDEILKLIQIDESSASPEAVAARAAKRDVSNKLFDLFNSHHSRVVDHERGKIAEAGAKKRLGALLDPSVHLDAPTGVMAGFQAIMKGTPFEAHFAQPKVASTIRHIIGQHFADIMHIERRWHCDDTEEAKAFRDSLKGA